MQKKNTNNNKKQKQKNPKYPVMIIFLLLIAYQFASIVMYVNWCSCQVTVESLVGFLDVNDVL